MTVAAIDSTGSGAAASSASNSAFGLNFQSLLNIILEQLTYQDPLKPLDNFQFVSQLAQFSQLEQSQTLNTTVTSLLAAQSVTEAVTLLGHTVATTGSSDGSTQSITGSVTAINISNGVPALTITTTAGQVLSNVAISSITSIQ